MRIRKLLTEILLEVTNQEIEMVTSEAIEEAKSKSVGSYWQVENGVTHTMNK